MTANGGKYRVRAELLSSFKGESWGSEIRNLANGNLPGDEETFYQRTKQTAKQTNIKTR